MLKIENIIKIDKEDELDLKLNLDDNINFSVKSQLIVPYDPNALIKQPIRNTCLLTSIYNAFPSLYDNDEKNLIKKIYYYNGIRDAKKFCKDFKKLKYKFIKNVDKFENMPEQYMSKNNKPILYAFKHKYGLEVHMIAFFGYDEKYYYYYFENGQNNVLEINVMNHLHQDLAFGIMFGKYSKDYCKSIGYEDFYNFRKNWGLKPQTDEYNRIATRLLTKDNLISNGKLTGISKNLLKENLEGISCITYKWNDKYFSIKNQMNRPTTFLNNLTERLKDIK